LKNLTTENKANYGTFYESGSVLSKKMYDQGEIELKKECSVIILKYSFARPASMKSNFSKEMGKLVYSGLYLPPY
jgi:hypothetical protein